MSNASGRAGVGPMAAVAGVLADLAVEEMIKNGCKVAVVENGGEVSAFSNQPIDIGFSAGYVPLSKEMGFRLTEFPMGVCTSSGKFSHAFSFGDADAVTIFANNATLADGAATRVANEVRGEDIEESIKNALDVAETIVGVKGAFICRGNKVGQVGNLPDFFKIEGNKTQILKEKIDTEYLGEYEVFE